MFSKRKQLESKLQQPNSARKTHQKHSRKPTKQRIPIPQSILLRRYFSSARTNSDKIYAYNMDSLIMQSQGKVSTDYRQAIYHSQKSQRLVNYYAFGSRIQQKISKPCIQRQLLLLIQQKHAFCFSTRPLMHFGDKIAALMDRHLQRRQQMIEKITTVYHSNISIPKKKVWPKQLTTLVSEKEEQEPLNTSESFQLKNLAECIRSMFSKQNKYDHLKESPCEGSWLLQHKEIRGKIIECDYSSIDGAFKGGFSARSQYRGSFNTQAQENYGLDQLKKKYEIQRQQRMSGSTVLTKRQHLGHKRNPTQALWRKDIYDPLTPKDHQARSAFGSSKNIALGSPKVVQKKSKSKGQVGPYQLQFSKKKGTVKRQKENVKCQVKAKTRVQKSSKSKSKEKGLKGSKSGIKL